MAKVARLFACNECGATYARWQGKCDTCGAWNSISEETPSGPVTSAQKKRRKTAPAQTVSLDGKAKSVPRLPTQIGEFDRVLGGGLVPGSAIIIGGDPGIGKSTFLLQVASRLAAQKNVLYLSGEESAEQIQLRAERLGLGGSPLELATTGHLETILATLEDKKPDLVVVDSIQTVASDAVDAPVPGTIAQVRMAAHELVQTAKKCGTILVLVGHVTKEGNIAGPKLLEHMVDTVLYFEGERGHSYRILRAFKNRYGAAEEIGVFDMGETGLHEVTNPSALFLSERAQAAPGSVVLPAINGSRPVLVEVQALVAPTTYAQPRRTCLGVDANRVAMLAAVLDKNTGSGRFSSHDLFVNVTGGLRVQEPAADLAIALALLSSSLNRPVKEGLVALGEIGLSGEIRGVSHAERRLKEAEKLGFTTAVLASNTKKASTGLRQHQVDTLHSLYAALPDLLGEPTTHA